MDNETPEFDGPVEVDEAYMGGIEGNKHASKRTHPDGGTVGKVAVVGIKDQDTGQVHAEVTESTSRKALQDVAHRNTTEGATAYTDDHKVYRGIEGVSHQTVNTRSVST